MLDYKGIDYRRVDLPNGVHRAWMKLLRFGGTRVPALKIDGRRVQGTREISRVLDRLQPDPPLFPSDPEQSLAVEEAERWGDEQLQDVPRKLTPWAFGKNRSGLEEFVADSRLVIPIPPRIVARIAAPLVWLQTKLNRADDEHARAALAMLPGLLDHVDSLIADGVIGGDQPNAADFQIASTVRLLTLFEDLRGPIERRPAGEFACKAIPDYRGHVASVFPAEWLGGLRAQVAS